MAEPLFYCYARCSTCAKAKKWLAAHSVVVKELPIKEDPPTKDQFLNWFDQTGRPLKSFFNTSGMAYRKLGLKDKLTAMTKEEAAELLASDGMLIKRPLLVTTDAVLSGFKEAAYEEEFSK